MFQHSVWALQIRSGEENGRIIFRVVYPSDFWKKVFSRGEVAAEKVALHRLERGMTQSIRNNAAAYEATMEAYNKKGLPSPTSDKEFQNLFLQF